MAPISSELLTVSQAASRLSLHPQTIYRKIDRGEIPVVRIGRSIRIKLSDVGLSSDDGVATRAYDKPLPPFLESLFWDVSFEKLRPDSRIVFERVLEYGDLSAIHWLLETVEEGQIIAFIRTVGRKRLSPRSLNFFRLVFGIGNEGKDINSKTEKSLGKTHWR